jgi:hypothetical protein
MAELGAAVIASTGVDVLVRGKALPFVGCLLAVRLEAGLAAEDLAQLSFLELLLSPQALIASGVEELLPGFVARGMRLM